MKQTVTIEVDVPEGWEFDRFDVPSVGEFLLLYRDGFATVREVENARYNLPMFIVRKAWQWPSWLKANYIAMDQNGDWWAYHFDPVIEGERWYAGDMTTHLAPEYFDFTPPPCNDWRQSKRRRP